MDEETTGKGIVPCGPQRPPSGLQANGATTALSREGQHYEKRWLKPCGFKVGSAELSACLVLVAPSGMTEAERQSWLSVARQTLRGIPEDLLKRGCQAARRHADHPAKIVREIMREVEAEWESRRRSLTLIERSCAPVLAAPTYEAIPHEETQRIIREARQSLEAPE